MSKRKVAVAQFNESRKEIKKSKVQVSQEEARTQTIVKGKNTPQYLYHLVHKSNLTSIQQFGLLSTERLLDHLNLPEKEKANIVTQHRPTSITLQDGIVIRDQSPMPPKALAKVLPEGMNPSDWYKLMNSFIFFWPELERVERHRNAHPKGTELSLLVFDADLMVRDLGDSLYVSPINTGFAMRKAAFRSEKSFTPYREYVANGWPVEEGRKPRAKSSSPVEFAVKHTMPLLPYLLRIE